jgi:hypothetical protein
MAIEEHFLSTEIRAARASFIRDLTGAPQSSIGHQAAILAVFPV